MKKEPLANRMRPNNLDEIVGQESIIGKGTVLRKRIETDNLLSIILWGSPGTGKTTIAEVIAKTTKYKFYKLNAVTAGVSDIKAIIHYIALKVAVFCLLMKYIDLIKHNKMCCFHI